MFYEVATCSPYHSRMPRRMLPAVSKRGLGGYQSEEYTCSIAHKSSNSVRSIRVGNHFGNMF